MRGTINMIQSGGQSPGFRRPRRGGGGYGEGPGMMPMGMMPQAAPQQAAPPPSPFQGTAGERYAGQAGGVGNRFGSTVAFQESINRQRALRARKAGVFADLRAAGKDMREAGERAFSDGQLAEADMKSGGFFQQRELTQDANTRANNETGAKVGLTASEAEMNRAKAKHTIPAGAAFDNARANVSAAEADSKTRMIPLDLDAAKIRNQAASEGVEYVGPGAAANVDATKAKTEATRAGVDQMKSLESQLKASQDRVKHLETRLTIKGGAMDFGNENQGQSALEEPPKNVISISTPPGGRGQWIAPPGTGGGQRPAAQPSGRSATSTNYADQGTPDRSLDSMQPGWKAPATGIPAAPAQPGPAIGMPAGMGGAQSPSAVAPQAGSPAPADLEYTAQKHGISVDEVKRRLGVQ